MGMGREGEIKPETVMLLAAVTAFLLMMAACVLKVGCTVPAG
jgi:hypothetical protein